jgi:phosphoserine phosphatase
MAASLAIGRVASRAILGCMARSIIVSDMDGTLSTAETWRGVQAWVTANHTSAAARRFVTIRLPLVALARSGLYGKETFRARWQRDQARLLRGVSATELTEMGTWVVEMHLWPARRQPAVDAVLTATRDARAAEPSTRLVLATGAYQPIGDAFAARIGADLALGTPLEVRDGVATGELSAPVQSGSQKAEAVRALADGGEVVAAFGDTAADIPLLALARRAVAVAPDRALRRVAVARGWEILED